MFAPCFACILAVMLGYVVQYGLIDLVWPCISIYLCVGTAEATFKFEPHGNVHAIGDINGTSHGYHFVPLYLVGWFERPFTRDYFVL